MRASELSESWREFLGKDLNSPSMKALKEFLKSERNQGKEIYPSRDKIFQAFSHTPFEAVKVVVIGQDPYHGPDQAHGLSFSVQPGVPTPPSLKNIFLELQKDLKTEIPTHGHLGNWASQGVLMLNQVLTVEKGRPGSHQKQGWEEFTDKVVQVLNEERENLVFLLWGSPAQKKAKGVDPYKHLVLKSPHPSPLSAYRGFFGCKHFSKCNDFLISKGIDPIDWNLH